METIRDLKWPSQYCHKGSGWEIHSGRGSIFKEGRKQVRSQKKKRGFVCLFVCLYLNKQTALVYSEPQNVSFFLIGGWF